MAWGKKRRGTTCNPETCHQLWLFCRTKDGKTGQRLILLGQAFLNPFSLV